MYIELRASNAKRSIDDCYSTHCCRNRYCDEILKVYAIIMSKCVYIVITWHENVFLEMGEGIKNFIQFIKCKIAYIKFRVILLFRYF